MELGALQMLGKCSALNSAVELLMGSLNICKAHHPVNLYPWNSFQRVKICSLSLGNSKPTLRTSAGLLRLFNTVKSGSKCSDF